MIRAMPSPGSSPCPKNPATCVPLSMLIAGASSRCSRTSNRAVSVDRVSQSAGLIAAGPPRLEQAGIAGFDLIGGAPGRVLQDARGGVDPAEGPPDVGPQRAGAVQTFDEQ